MKNSQKGFSLVEMMIALSLASVLGVSGYSLYLYSKKNTTRISDDIHTTIARLGASAVLKKDLSGSELSFNYLNMKDDQGLAFFTHAKNQYCKHKECSRTLTLSIKEDQTKSKAIYLIVRKNLLNEVQKLTVHPKVVFNNRKYEGINWQHSSVTHSISRNHFPLTSWEKNRVMLVSSENDFFDCNLSSKSNNSSQCRIECPSSGGCDFTIKRPYRFLGVVDPEPSIDMSEVTIDNNSDLLLKEFNICRPNKNNGCAAKILTNISSTKNLYENLPYTPGADDRTSIYHVEVVKYYLEKEGNQTHLLRALGSYENGRINFHHAIKIMSGLSGIVFKRANVSNPAIEYKFLTINNKDL